MKKLSFMILVLIILFIVHPSAGFVNAATISDIIQDNVIPLSGEDLTVACRASDPDGITEVYLIASFYDSSVVETITMNNDSLDYYSCVIPSKNNGCRTEYLIYAVNTLNDTTPADSAGRFFWGYTSIPKLKEIDSQGYPRYFGYSIRSTGIVTTETGTFTTGNNIINFQQNYILGAVIKTESTEPHCLVGDSITAEGTIGMWSGQTRIEPPNSKITLHSSGHSLDTIFITADELMDTVGENYEGLLAMIDCYGIHDGNWPRPNQNTALWMKNESIVSKGDICDTFLMWCDKDTDLDGSDEPGWHERILGIISQYDTEAPYFSGYQMMPRSYSDVLTGMSTALSGCHISFHIDNGVHLRWHIENRNNLSVLRLERRQSGNDYYEILSILDADADSYHDRTIIEGNSYEYRLRAVYSDSRILTLNSVNVKTGSIRSDASVSIDSSEDVLIADIHSISVARGSFSIYNASGMCVKSTPLNNMNNYSRLYIDISDIPPGVYFALLKSGERKYIEKFNLVK